MIFFGPPAEHSLRPAAPARLKIHESLDVEARIRYRQPLEKDILHKVENGIFVEFQNPQSAIQEGQFVAWYKNEELLGSGVIS